MGFTTPKEIKRFLDLCPQGIEKFLVDGGTILIKLWLEVGNDEQQRRFEAHVKDTAPAVEAEPDGPALPEALVRVFLRTRRHAQEDRYAHRGSDRTTKRTARLNTIAHLLSVIPHKKLQPERGEAAEALVEGRVRRRCVDRAAAVRARALLRGFRRLEVLR